MKCWIVSTRNKTTREEVKTGILVSRRRQTIRKEKKTFGHWYVVGFQERIVIRPGGQVLNNVENLEVFVTQTLFVRRACLRVWLCVFSPD